MDRKTYTVRRWVVVIVTLAISLVLLWLSRPVVSIIDAGWLASLAALTVTTAFVERKRISFGRAGSFSPAPLLFYVIALAFGPWAMLPVVAVMSRSWKTLSSKLFNAAQYVVHIFLGAAVFRYVNELGQGLLAVELVAHALAIAAFIGVNLGLVTLIKVASGEGSAAVLWSAYYAPIIPIYADNLIHGAICVLVLERIGWMGVAFAIYLAYSKLSVHVDVVGPRIGRALSAESLIQAIDAKDAYTKDHSNRVSQYAQAIAQQLHLPKAVQTDIAVASQLHDIGKIATPDAVLQKAGPLTDDEFRVIQEHPLKSQQILAANPQLARIAEIVSQHHERYDGKGYPHGLRGEAIRLEARITACADAFDAMTTDRPYRKALSREAAIRELLKHRGAQFDPVVVDALLRHLNVSIDAALDLATESVPASARPGARLSISIDNS